jgi:signal peptidase II
VHVSEKIVPLNKKILLSLLIIFICFLLDRLTKIYTIKFLIENKIDNYYINEFFNLTLTWNRGIAFGLFQSEDLFYHLISFLIFLIILLIIFFIIKSKLIFEIVLYSMITGGALGNFFDRIYYRAVLDFIDLHYQNFHWFTFNVSDICISVAIILLLIFDIFNVNKKILEK